MPSWTQKHCYEVSSKYSLRVPLYGVRKDSLWKINQRAVTQKLRKESNHFCTWHAVLTSYILLWIFIKIFPMDTWLWCKEKLLTVDGGAAGQRHNIMSGFFFQNWRIIFFTDTPSYLELRLLCFIKILVFNAFCCVWSGASLFANISFMGHKA